MNVGIMFDLYPLMMGDAALERERIPYVPDVEDAQRCVLVFAAATRCGAAVVPPGKWALRPRLEIVGEGATRHRRGLPPLADDDRQAGDHDRPAHTNQANRTQFVHPAGWDYLDGAVLSGQDCHRFVERLASHHAILVSDDVRQRRDEVAGMAGIGVDRI